MIGDHPTSHHKIPRRWVALVLACTSASIWGCNRKVSPEERECLLKRRSVDYAKRTFAGENLVRDYYPVELDEILPYMASDMMPSCPAGGRYDIGAVGEFPHCSAHLQGGDIHRAAARGDAAKVKRLLGRGAGVDLTMGLGCDTWTPLHYAAFAGHADVAEFLLERGADVNAVTVGLRTPLDLAGNPQVIKALQRHGGRSGLKSHVERKNDIERVSEMLHLALSHTFERPNSYTFNLELRNDGATRLDVTVFQSVFRTEFRLDAGDDYTGYSGGSDGDAGLCAPGTALVMGPGTTHRFGWSYTKTVDYTVINGRVIRVSETADNARSRSSGDIGGNISPQYLNQCHWASASLLVRVVTDGMDPLEMWLRSPDHRFLVENPPQFQGVMAGENPASSSPRRCLGPKERPSGRTAP